VADVPLGVDLYQGCHILRITLRLAFLELLAVSLHRERARAVNRRAHLLWSRVAGRYGMRSFCLGWMSLGFSILSLLAL
jgi:hypothetical protein